jgi:rhodanese-related sulfurtransferase
LRKAGIILTGIFFSLSVLFFACSEEKDTPPDKIQQKDTIETKKQPDTVSVEELFKLMDEPGYIALDVRNSVDYETKNVPNSLNLQFNSALFKENIQTLDNDMTYLIVSNSDEESGKAAEVLKSAGFKTILVKNGKDAFK